MKKVKVEWTETVEFAYEFLVDDDFDPNEQEALEAHILDVPEEDSCQGVTERDIRVLGVEPYEPKTVEAEDVPTVTPRRYRVLMRHDNGEIAIEIVSSSPERAVQLVCAAENAPRRSVVTVGLVE